MKETMGILVGVDERQEWLLPWWWSFYLQHSAQYEVAFADFGMSSRAKSWCKERGTLITISEKEIASYSHLNEKVSQDWEKWWQARGEVDDFWSIRAIWFKKPLAMHSSPFQRTLWLDLDCEIRGKLDPLFHLSLLPSKFSIFPTNTSLSLINNRDGKAFQFPHHNSGVVLFEKDSPLLELWVNTLKEGSFFTRTEEELLSFLIAYYAMPIQALESKWNWAVTKEGENEEALIYHWMGKEGKEVIKALGYKRF